MTDGTTNGVRIESEIARAIPRKHIEERLGRMINRARGACVTAQVFFTDVNGAKGGLDVRCVLRATIAGQRPIATTRVGETPRLAFDDAYDAMLRRLDSAQSRREQAGRRPKKYFAARRLLG